MTTVIDYLRLADDQRGVIHDAIAVRTDGLREGEGDLSLRALGERLLAYSRLEDFADGFGPLTSEDRPLLVKVLGEYRLECTESADSDEEDLFQAEAGVGGHSMEIKGYIVRERLSAKLCAEVLELLGVSDA